MAYADGELNEEARRETAHRVASDPAFALRVAHYQRLDVTARTATSPEPQDIVNAKLAASSTQQATLGLGWFALVTGTFGFYAWLIFEISQDPELDILPKVFILGGIGGFLLLFLSILRNRLRELPYDPYTKIKR
jgi:uncharacterized protein with PQ loop repeat